MNDKEKVSEFKKNADDFNKGLYQDINSYKNGFLIILAIIILIVLVYFLR